MSRNGDSVFGLLHGLHVDGCDGTEYTSCRPVVLGGPSREPEHVEVVYMAWCGECGAADYEVV